MRAPSNNQPLFSTRPLPGDAGGGRSQGRAQVRGCSTGRQGQGAHPQLASSSGQRRGRQSSCTSNGSNTSRLGSCSPRQACAWAAVPGWFECRARDPVARAADRSFSYICTAQRQHCVLCIPSRPALGRRRRPHGPARPLVCVDRRRACRGGRQEGGPAVCIALLGSDPLSPSSCAAGPGLPCAAIR